MNSQPPVRGGRQGNWDWLSKSRGATNFGHGVRWWFCTIDRVEWSIALSVPLGLLAVILIAIAPTLFVGDAADTAWITRLASVWVMGLAAQAAMTQTLFSVKRPFRRPSSSQASSSATLDVDAPPHGVTLTMGGVWMAIPDLVFDVGDREMSDVNDRRRRSVLETFSGASRVLALWSVLLLTLGLGVMACLIVDTATTSSTFEENSATSFVTSTEPSATIAAVNRPWIAAGWILCLQGLWQLMPLPQSLGRVGWSAAIGLFAQHSDASASERVKAQHAVRIVRWWLVASALMTLIVGVLVIHTSGISTQPGGRALPAIAGVTLLALWLFASARGEDLFASQLTLASNQETGVLKSRIGMRTVIQRWRTVRREREQTQRLIVAAQRERAEADDAARADEILQHLHADGPAALTDAERAILSRVSEAIRRERARDEQNPHSR